MDIAQLQYFKVIAETGSLTKAARLLHVSQPAMSAMLKKLEEELGAELFDRSPNRIYLNQTGEIALIHVKHILRSVEQMQTDLLNTVQQNLTLRIAFCDPGVRLFTVPRFTVSHPEIQTEDELYEGSDTVRFLSERVYDLMVTPEKVRSGEVESRPYLSDQVFLSVPMDSKLTGLERVSLKDIPGQPLLYPQIGGYFLSQIEKIIIRDGLPLTLVKNDYNITQHLIRTSNFLATVSTLSQELRNDGPHRTLIPLDDLELKVTYYVTFLKARKERVKRFLTWAEEIRGDVALV